VLADEDVERLGAVAKCTPPIRAASEREQLWRALSDGTLPMVASDHSPAEVELKQGDDFFAIWGGIAGCQTMLELLLSEGHHQRGIALKRIVEATTRFVARRFGLPGKGTIEIGSDADLTFVALDEEHSISADRLFYRHPISPYVGMRLRGRVVRTMVRGTTVFENGRIVSGPCGRLVRPTPAEREVSAGAR
jgi:allantoinase